MSSIGSASKSYAIDNRANQSFTIGGSGDDNEESDANSVSSTEDADFKGLNFRPSTNEEEKKPDTPESQ